MDRSLSRARLIAILAPNALLWGAIGFQYLGGLSPCQMCYWQRWPHLAAILLTLGAIGLRANRGLSAMLTMLSALAILTSGLIGGFHAGVEYGWWEGLTTCATGLSGGGGGQSALDAIMNAPLVRCDVAAWSLFGISMAGYNFLISVVVALGILTLVSRWKGGA
ncbi:disulfide bond formation protein B [Sphingobium sufflavum]|uniref:disulfide bond formation protein B n=1 Tax=Sphingobium sufflavum TaxID=1129547 RepID=UPI001F2A0573|nr:disulfide bond formation protein B [Sphingobium sufflavum]MCE7795130.1 disulfide bond formation protein B [Sphingobium sufflavum]